MGFILLICFVLTIAAIGLVCLLAVYIIYFIRKSFLKKINYVNFITICFSLPILAISIIISVQVFKIFYNEFGSYIWLPLINNEIKLVGTNFGDLTLFEEVDRVTGAAGGVKIKRKLFLISDKRKDEIEFTTEPVYQKPEISVSLKDNSVNNPPTKSLYPGYLLYIDPKVFTLEEFGNIASAISDNITEIDKSLNSPREPLKYFNGSQNRIPQITGIYYLSRDSLNREYNCDNGTSIKVYPNGGSRIFFAKEVKRMNGAILKEYPLGKLKENGHHMYIGYNIENFNVDNEKNKLTLFNTIVKDCYDSKKRNFFNEYTFEQEILIKSNQ